MVIKSAIMGVTKKSFSIAFLRTFLIDSKIRAAVKTSYVALIPIRPSAFYAVLSPCLKTTKGVKFSFSEIS